MPAKDLHVLQVVGTAEFSSKYERMRGLFYDLLQAKNGTWGPLVEVMEAIDAACLKAYEKGFNEALCK